MKQIADWLKQLGMHEYTCTLKDCSRSWAGAHVRSERRCVRPRADPTFAEAWHNFPTCQTSKVAQKQQSIVCGARSRLHRTSQ